MYQLVEQSMMKTLPLIVALNTAFGKKPFTDESSKVEILERMVGQTKLSLDELHETIKEESLDLVMDGIGDLITTSDGAIGFLAELFPEELEGFVSEASSNIIQWDKEALSTLTEYDFVTPKNVDEIMATDYLEFVSAWATAKSFLEFGAKDEKLAEFFEDKEPTFISNYLGECGCINFDDLIFDLLHVNVAMRVKIDNFSRSLGFDPVKILEEVNASNMSKFCDTIEKAEQTIANYVGRGLTCLEIVESGLEGKWFVRTTEEAMFKGQLIPKGKFMKGVDFFGPDFSDTQRFEL